MAACREPEAPFEDQEEDLWLWEGANGGLWPSVKWLHESSLMADEAKGGFSDIRSS